MSFIMLRGLYRICLRLGSVGSVLLFFELSSHDVKLID